jgi:hypothetical protein
MVERFWKPYIWQVVGDELDFMVLIVGAEERAAVFAATFDNFQYSTRLIPESRSFTTNNFVENLLQMVLKLTEEVQ